MAMRAATACRVHGPLLLLKRKSGSPGINRVQYQEKSAEESQAGLDEALQEA